MVNHQVEISVKRGKKTTNYLIGADYREDALKSWKVLKKIVSPEEKDLLRTALNLIVPAEEEVKVSVSVAENEDGGLVIEEIEVKKEEELK